MSSLFEEHRLPLIVAQTGEIAVVGPVEELVTLVRTFAGEKIALVMRMFRRRYRWCRSQSTRMFGFRRRCCANAGATIPVVTASDAISPKHARFMRSIKHPF
jgi:hypothetical protein